MCGIFGFYSFNQTRVDRGRFESSLLKMIHRGPDAQNALYLSDDRIALGHVRLSIIDLSTKANQPMQVGKYTVIFNGELYNYLEIIEDLKQKGYSFCTNSDTEVLVSAFDFWGEHCVDRFNGMWAFAIYNSRTDVLFCSRDRFGVKPFNYYQDNHVFLFSSEVKSILAYKPELRVPNYNSIGLYCREGINGEIEETWLEKIFRLSPGHNLIIKEGKQSIYKYYNYPSKIDRNIAFNDAKGKFLDLFNDSVKIRMRSDVPVGTTLSGGLDSTSIVSSLRTFYHGTHKTFTATFDNFENDEWAIADRTNKLLNLSGFPVKVAYGNDYFDTLTRIVYHLESGHFSPAIVPLWEVYKSASQEVKVVLEGQGSDELLGGYIELSASQFLIERLQQFKIKSFLSNFGLLQKNNSPKAMLVSLVRNNLSYNSREIVRKYLLNVNKVLIGPLKESVPRHNISLNSESSFTKYLQKSHQSTLVNLLHYGDAISMAFSLESRLPFMDYRLVDFVMTLPSEYIIANGRGKFIQREALKPLLPTEVYSSTMKLGFPSPSKFFMDCQRPIIREILLDSKIKGRGLFSTRHLETLLKNSFANFNQPDRFVFRLICLELWFRQFVDD